LPASLYDILELPRYASIQEVRSAFKRLAVKYHPDRHPGRPELEEKFKELSHAYTVLGDEDNKRDYDIRLSGFFFQEKNKSREEDRQRKRREMVAEMLRKKKEKERDKIVRDWDKIRNGAPLWLRRSFHYSLIAVGVCFIFRHWFYTQESFSPIYFVFAMVFIITGNVLEQNLNYTLFLYRQLHGKISFNLYRRVLLNMLSGIVISVCAGVGGAHLSALYHFKKYPARVQADVQAIYVPERGRDIRIVYRYRVNGQTYTKDVPDAWREEAVRKRKLWVRYSYVNPVFSKIIGEEE
jgi:curved DNA-binding protein CbpA